MTNATFTLRSIRTLRNARRLALYTINGRNAASFVPTKLDDAGAETWLRASLGCSVAAPVDRHDALNAALKAVVEANPDFDVALWEKHGMSRVYIALNAKANGGKSWNGGFGWKGFIDTKTSKLTVSHDYAGAKTRNLWREDVESVVESVFAAVALFNA